MNLERFTAALGPSRSSVGTEDATRLRSTSATSRTTHARCGPERFSSACRGRTVDGHAFAATAAAAGAAALVVERPLAVDLPQLVVADVRAAMPNAADALLRRPVRELTVAAVTGTNGKTTTAFLLHAILRPPAARRAC